MPTYAELTKLPAEAYLNPHNFITAMDHAPADGYAIQRYFDGRLLARDGVTAIIICANGTWAAEGPRTMITSYEGIGYHSCTASLLLGFLDSELPIYVDRYDQPRKRIK